MRNIGKFIKTDLKISEISKNKSSLAEIVEFENCLFCTHAGYRLHAKFQSFLKSRTPLPFAFIQKKFTAKAKVGSM